VVINKTELLTDNEVVIKTTFVECDSRNDICKQNIGIEMKKNKLLSFVNTGALHNNETIVTNTRHYDSLLKALEEVTKVKYGLEITQRLNGY
jgi:tRNA modification GTPase